MTLETLVRTLAFAYAQALRKLQAGKQSPSLREKPRMFLLKSSVIA